MEKEILNCKEKYPRRALLIINPVSGKKLVIRYIPEIIRRLMDSGYLVTTAVTSRRGEATEIAAQLGADYDLVCCTGGDGTLNECVNGAAGLSNVAVTHFPCGTGNDFIKMFGPDKDRFFDLTELMNGEVRPIDVIDCNGRYSVNICSMGLDARIGTDVHKYSGMPLVGGAAG